MKKLLFSLIIICLFCSCNSKTSNESTDIELMQTSTAISTETIATTSTITTTNTTATTTSAALTTTQPTETSTSDEDIIRAIEIDSHGEWYESYLDERGVIYNGKEYIEYPTHIDYIIKTAEDLSNQYLGEISDESDLQSKARVAFMELVSEDFIINEIEIDSIEKNGIEMKIERDYPYYNIIYYDDYDVWYIHPNAPVGTLEDGSRYDMPLNCYTHMLVRGSDGKVIAAHE